MEDSHISKKKRKEEGKRLKKQRIQESGGVRPRTGPAASSPSSSKRSKTSHGGRSSGGGGGGFSSSTKHRFGRVMDSVPCRNAPRHSTLSIALPGSVVSNCQTRELKTQLVGQISRYATIYHVDEIVIFDDKLAKEHKPYFGSRRNQHHSHRPRASEGSGPRGVDNVHDKNDDGDQQQQPPSKDENDDTRPKQRSDPHTFMARVLQYCECPQYLRRHFFPMHPDLQFSGLLAPIDAPHHVRAHDRCKYREGVVLDKTGPNKGSLVNCGIRGRPVE